MCGQSQSKKEDGEKKEEKKEEEEEEESDKPVVPLDKATIDEFAESMMPGELLYSVQKTPTFDHRSLVAHSVFSHYWSL